MSSNPGQASGSVVSPSVLATVIPGLLVCRKVDYGGPGHDV